MSGSILQKMIRYSNPCFAAIPFIVAAAFCHVSFFLPTQMQTNDCFGRLALKPPLIGNKATWHPTLKNEASKHSSCSGLVRVSFGSGSGLLRAFPNNTPNNTRTRPEQRSGNPFKHPNNTEAGAVQIGRRGEADCHPGFGGTGWYDGINPF